MIMLRSQTVRIFYCIVAGIAATIFAGCGSTTRNAKTETGNNNIEAALRDSIQLIADSYPGEIGVALITDRGDTLAVNDTAKYPLMSVFKLHQAIALCHMLDVSGISLDSLVVIRRDSLDSVTWSPMLKDHAGKSIEISLRDLLRYAVTQSDNNASNYLFEHLQSVERTDTFISGIIPRETFSLRYTEKEMGADHFRCYDNRTSPLGAALLIDRLYADDSLLEDESLKFLRTALIECKTGNDRIVAPLTGIEGVKVGHKTGSGYMIGETLTCHNDIGHIELPDGRSYTLAVFVKDLKGNETQASSAISRISSTVYNAIISTK